MHYEYFGLDWTEMPDMPAVRYAEREHVPFGKVLGYGGYGHAGRIHGIWECREGMKYAEGGTGSVNKSCVSSRRQCVTKATNN